MLDPPPCLYRSPELDSRTVRQHFRGAALAEFCRVVAHSDNGIGADLERVLDHSIERLPASLFADDRKFFYIAAGYRFDAADKTAPDAGGTHDDPADNAQIFTHLSAVDTKSCCNDHKSISGQEGFSLYFILYPSSLLFLVAHRGIEPLFRD